MANRINAFAWGILGAMTDSRRPDRETITIDLQICRGGTEKHSTPVGGVS
jgi:hypothetical protein